MGKKKKTFEMNFGTLLLIIIGICCIIFAFKNFSKGKTKAENNQNENINSTENITEEQTEEKIYSNNVISLDIGKLSDSWKVVEKQNGSIIFYIQGPIKQNEDGTTDDIRINVYLEKSSMTNDELKTQMLEHSVYSNIEYTKIQLIDDVQWRQFDAENKEQKAKILAIMKDGYMYAIEITGEKSLYEQYYNEAMRTVMTVKFAERIPEDFPPGHHLPDGTGCRKDRKNRLPASVSEKHPFHSQIHGFLELQDHNLLCSSAEQWRRLYPWSHMRFPAGDHPHPREGHICIASPDSFSMHQWYRSSKGRQYKHGCHWCKELQCRWISPHYDWPRMWEWPAE